ncbi:MAG: cytochrome b5-like heme/steroid binding domain-containing protein [Myxococcota bacterium]
MLWLAVAQAGVPVVSAEALASHARADDCWIALHGEVFDVTDFAPAHPGGPVLLDVCGTDATALFEARPGGEGGPHSDGARGLLDGLRVGVLEGAATPGAAATWRVLDPMRARFGVVAPTGVIVGHQQLHFGFAHHFHFPDTPANNTRLELGWGFFNRADLVLAYSTWSGEAGGQVRFAFLQEDGRRRVGSLDRGAAAPLTVVLVVTGGVRTADEVPDEEKRVFTTQIVVERSVGPVTLTVAPGARFTGVVAPYGSAVVELRPHVTGGLFGEMVVSRLGQRLQYRVSGGVRAYTRAHAFSMWGGTSPSLAPGEQASPIGGAGFGFSISRRFPFPGG